MIKKSLTHALLSFIIALFLFLPITGFVLQGFKITTHLQRPLLLATFVFIGSFLIHACSKSTLYNKILQQLLRKKNLHTKKGSAHEKRSYPFIALFLISLIIPLFLEKYWLSIAILALIYILLGLGLNIVVGLAGLLDLGFVAFYAVGAYTYALGAEYWGLNFWIALPMAACVAACFGAVLGFPVLRMHGDYLAIVTLGFGEIIRLILNNWSSFTHGPNGVSVPKPTFFGLSFSRTSTEGPTFYDTFHLPYQSEYQYLFIYFLLLITVFLVLHFVTRLHRMPLGRAWEAIREDEIACRSLGINHVTTKLSAFVLGAMMGGIGGVFFAAYQGFVNPSSFTFIESAIILAIVVLGGMGSALGVVIAAILITLLPELLREFEQFRMFAFGSMLVLMMAWRPRGLVRIKRQWFSKPTETS